MMRTQRSSKLQQQGVFGAPTNQTYVVLTNATAAGDATVAGARLQTFLLERSRVVAVAAGERGYHVFYGLLSAPLAKTAGLGSHGKAPKDFGYLRPGAASLAGRDDAADFASMLAALDRGFGTLDRREVASTSAQEARVRIAALTPREQDILRGLVRGHPNKTIAFDLGISARTVDVHRAHVMTKLGVHSLSYALRLAFAAGMDAG